jgi:glucose-1-phosphate adenylyltransferase
VHIAPLHPRDVLILSGDQLYRMDFGPMLRQHRHSGAAATVAAKPVPQAAISSFGLLRIGRDGRVESFCEKPQDLAMARGYELGPDLRDPELAEPQFAASMGIYVFRMEALVGALANSRHTDFGHELLPELVQRDDVRAFPFQGYWEDIGTIRAYYEANLELARPKPRFGFHRHGAAIFTEPRFLGASRVERCSISESMICDGCSLHAESIERSVVGIRAIVGPRTRVVRSLIMGADGYEGDLPRPPGAPQLGIGRECHIEGAIIDKNVRIGDGVRIAPKPAGTREDHEHYFIRDGIVIVPKNAILQAGTVI